MDARPGSRRPTGKVGWGRCSLSLLACLGLCAAALPLRAALQFDVFLGYDGIVPEASWFPVVCEVKNDGPAFTGVVELSGGTFGQGQSRRVVVELPTGTLKRFVIPVFSTTRYLSSWDARLLDEKGKVRAEQPGLSAKRKVAWESPLVGAITRGIGGTPALRPITGRHADLQPGSARLQPPLFPDNPLVLEGLDVLYLSSERAVDLKETQVKALLAWLRAGGHLVVGVEQISDINSSPWLAALFPCELKDVRTVESHLELQQWLREGSRRETESEDDFSARGLGRGAGGAAGAENPFADLPGDPAFESAPLQVATGPPRGARVVVAAGDTPLILTTNWGRGRITGLMFSPEREPFRSWKNSSSFWSKLAEVPPVWYTKADYSYRGSWSSDGVFGAMIDSKQVRKLPVGWLLLLLLAYLLVIGPLDQMWLKRLGRPMLTWITFPCYVVLFSVLIYFIGYKLRAGETEWNELHVVDVLVNGDRAELRGRTYASVYSPVNAKYRVESQQQLATLRGEFVGSWGGGQESERAEVLHDGDHFRAEIFVPVWTSQLYVSDWWQSSALPLDVAVTPLAGRNWQVRVENRLDRTLTHAKLVVDNYVIELGQLPARQSKTFTVSRSAGTPLGNFVGQHGAAFQSAVQSRQMAFGSSTGGRLLDLPNSTAAVSFASEIQRHSGQGFITPPGLDLSPLVERGHAVLLAWAADYSPIKPLNQFTPRRSSRNTMWRVAVPVNQTLPGLNLEERTRTFSLLDNYE